MDRMRSGLLTLALPDGHQQGPTMEFLGRTSLRVEGYGKLDTRRLSANLPGLAVKVVRPQDMPTQVAVGHFDLAITGKDWLMDHRARFPNAPVDALLKLNLEYAGSKLPYTRIVAVVTESMKVTNVEEFRRWAYGNGAECVRVASELVNLADQYARTHHFGRYRVIPTWGATEAFLPEDADLIIEVTETGSTLRKNGLVIIDELLRSTAHLIVNRSAMRSREKRPIVDAMTEDFMKAGAEEAGDL